MDSEKSFSVVLDITKTLGLHEGGPHKEWPQLEKAGLDVDKCSE
jgi:hypothetical protein